MSLAIRNSFALFLICAPALLAAKCQDGPASMGGDAGAPSAGRDGSDYPEPESGAGGNSGEGSGPRGGAHFGGTPGGGRNEAGSPPAAGTGGRPMGSAGSGGGSNDQCDAWNNAPITDAVTIRIVNDTDAPIHFGKPEQDCTIGPHFRLEDPSGSEVGSAFSGCITCEHAQRTIGGCPAICYYQPLLVIPPGESHDIEWDARVVKYVHMASACYYGDFEPFGCEQAIAAPSGRYTFFARAWTDWKCESGAPCQCTDNEDGTCTYTGPALVSGEFTEKSATLDYPSEKLVELRFD